MVEWTDFERATIQNRHSLFFFFFIHHYKTGRYFGAFGNLYNPTAIKSNPMIANHGKVVLHGLDRAVKNMDNIKEAYAELSVLHSEKLHVDPDNFRLLSDCLTIEVGARMGKDFNGEVQAAFQKFLLVVVSALGRQYH
uniref:Globin domain-containing protein n=1 Tax=Mola mola TaxID=94237 RepID=A0A3Q3WUZ5_MOLML